MTIFNSIGGTYNKTRAADERIVSELIRLINPEKENPIIADIGAGTGNYSVALADAGYQVRAIEPSATMLSNSQGSTNIEWIIGCAEALPLQTESVDVVVSLLALPHFVDIDRAFGEMARISKKGPIVIFAFDPRIGTKTRIYQYFPFCWDAFSYMPNLEDMAKILGNYTNFPTQIVSFNLPADLKDNFAAAAWRRPHLYLDPAYRANISSFRVAGAAVVNECVQRLAADLENGHWEKSYGEVLHMDSMDAGYCFLVAG